MQLVVSVVHRGAPKGEDGLVYVVDWESKRVLETLQPPGALIDEFPDAGGASARGYRGVCFVENLCYVAGSDTIHVYDSDWRLQRQISHTLFNDLHEIAWDGDALWVVSTGIDAVLKLTADGELIEAYVLGEFGAAEREAIGVRAREIDRSVDHRLVHYPSRRDHVAHPNAVQIVSGRPYVTLFFQGSLIALDPVELLWQDTAYYGSHSGRIVNGTVYLAASFRQSLLLADRRSSARTEISLLSDAAMESRGLIRRTLHSAALAVDTRGAPVRKLIDRVPERLNPRPMRDRPGWARGLHIVDQHHVLVGSSPASVALVDTEEQRVVDRIALSDRVGDSVFSVEVDARAA